MRIRDSLSGELRELEAGPDGRIGIYVCGPTVYNRIHVGNARPFVVFQLMKRYLEWRGQPVHLVENITDVNEKIDTATRPAYRQSGLDPQLLEGVDHEGLDVHSSIVTTVRCSVNTEQRTLDTRLASPSHAHPLDAQG